MNSRSSDELPIGVFAFSSETFAKDHHATGFEFHLARELGFHCGVERIVLNGMDGRSGGLAGLRHTANINIACAEHKLIICAPRGP